MLRLPLQVFLSREKGNVRLRSASFVSHGHNEKHFEETMGLPAAAKNREKLRFLLAVHYRQNVLLLESGSMPAGMGCP